MVNGLALFGGASLLTALLFTPEIVRLVKRRWRREARRRARGLD